MLVYRDDIGIASGVPWFLVTRVFSMTCETGDFDLQFLAGIQSWDEETLRRASNCVGG